MTMQEFYSARELASVSAERGLRNFPGTERGVRDYAQREGWTALPDNLCRKRSGREGGGGLEYHYSVLPDVLQAVIRGRETREALQCAAETRLPVERRQMEVATATDLTARQRAVMEARAAVLLEIERRRIAGGMMVSAAITSLVTDCEAGRLPDDLIRMAATANDRCDGSPRLSRTRLYAWRGDKESHGIAALAPRLTRKPEALPDWFPDFMRFYAVPQKRTVAHALDMWRRAEPEADVPSYRQVRIALGKLGAVERERGRMGAQSLKALQAYRSRDTSDLLPTSVYVADGKTFDAEIAHPIHGQPFRPEITQIVDAHTRRIVGISFDLSETTRGVADALRMACCEAGICALFYTDNGPGYVNAAMDDDLVGLLGRLGITPMRALPYNSQAKGIVERANHVWSVLAREMPTYISRDMDKEAKQLVHKRTRKELREFGASRVLPAWDAFVAACMDAVARYNDRPHSALPRIADPETGKWRNMSPAEAWHVSVTAGFESIIVTPEEQRDLFRPWVVRKAHRCIVKWLDNSYFAEELEQYHGRDVIVGYEPTNAQHVYVREIDIVEGARRPGRLIAVARFEGHKTRFVPLTAERAAVEKRARERVRRLEGHIQEAQAELLPVAMLDAPAANLPPTPMVLDLTAAVVPEAANSLVMPAPKSQEKRLSANGRPRFADDAEFATWIINNPDQITDADRAYLRGDVLNGHTNREWLRMRGIDLAALQALTRSTAA